MLGSHWLTCTFIFSSYTFTQTCILSKIAGPTNFDWLGLCFPIRGWATARRPATLTFITSHNNVRIILYHIAVKSAMGKCFWHRWSLLEICLLYCCQRIVQDQVAQNNLILNWNCWVTIFFLSWSLVHTTSVIHSGTTSHAFQSLCAKAMALKTQTWNCVYLLQLKLIKTFQVLRSIKVNTQNFTFGSPKP